VPTDPGAIFQQFPVPAAVVDGEGRVVAMNRAWAEGAKVGQLWRRIPEGGILAPPGVGGPGTLGRALGAVLMGETGETHVLLASPDGSSVRVGVAAIDLPGGRGATVHLDSEGVLADTAARRYHFLVDRASDAFFLADPSGRLLEVNAAAEELSGYARVELVGLTLNDLTTAEVGRQASERLGLLLREGRSVLHETVILRKDGTEVPVEISAQRLSDGRIQGVVRDVTSRKKLEDQLRVSQRIESVGRLAGGIAHDFNNLITVISGHADLLLATMPPGDPTREDLQEIKSAAGRAASLTRQLLAFSRRQVFELRNLDLNVVVSRMESMMRRVIGEDVELVFLPGPSLWAMRGDPGQLEQVLLNLVMNARDAMPRGGELLIRTSNVELDLDFVDRHVGSSPGAHVLLEVRDTGEGMTEETLEKVFEPFFTTKGPGKGTGLGLAMVYGIVKQSSGYIAVESEPGFGTAMRLYFPQVEGEVEEDELQSEETREEGTETILLVEDQEMVRALARRILAGLGYRVIETRDAGEALHAARELGEAIDLLLTDVVMPRMGGRELASILLEGRPDLKVLFMSGYTDDAVMHHGALKAGQGFLQKPFNPSSLSRKVRDVLDGRNPPG
jgi:two-component system, cell cycle sensor histidine kinase and response regulator CckA